MGAGKRKRHHFTCLFREKQKHVGQGTNSCATKLAWFSIDSDVFGSIPVTRRHSGAMAKIREDAPTKVYKA